MNYTVLLELLGLAVVLFSVMVASTGLVVLAYVGLKSLFGEVEIKVREEKSKTNDEQMVDERERELVAISFMDQFLGHKKSN